MKNLKEMEIDYLFKIVVCRNIFLNIYVAFQRFIVGGNFYSTEPQSGFVPDLAKWNYLWQYLVELSTSENNANQ